MRNSVRYPPRAGDEEAGRETDHRRGEEVGIAHPAERGQEVPPSPGTKGVDGDGHQDQADEGEQACLSERLDEGAPVDAPEEPDEEDRGEQGPEEEAPALPPHRLSVLTKSSRSNT